MTSATSTALPDVGLTPDGLWRGSFRAMASPIRVQFGGPTFTARRSYTAVRAMFAEVERQCTRFDPDSDLMRANAAGDEPTRVGEYCLAALHAAYDAHLLTGGLFDPRVLLALGRLGYDRSLPFAAGPVHTPEAAQPSPLVSPWEPVFDDEARTVRIGPDPVDLGGIGKGLALRWAATLLEDATCHLVDAGGDCVFAGGGPDGTGWRIGIEDPAGGAEPVAVLRADAGAVTTSSVRLRSWRAGDRKVHHLVDPRTGTSGASPLASVTVVGADPALAEVWSKSLFLCGTDIASAAAERGLPALWVDQDGALGYSRALEPFLLWRRA